MNRYGVDGWFTVYHYGPTGNIHSTPRYHENVRPVKQSAPPLQRQPSSDSYLVEMTEEEICKPVMEQSEPETLQPIRYIRPGNIAQEDEAEYNELANLALTLHNELRKKHLDTGPLIIDADCCKTAQYHASLKVYQHSPPDQRNGYGENIAWSYGTTKKQAVEMAVEFFYNEIKDYDWSDPINVAPGAVVGHFTQVSCKFCTR